MRNVFPLFFTLTAVSMISSGLLLTGCQQTKPEPKSLAETAVEERPVLDVLILRKQAFGKNLRMPGELLPNEVVDIHPKIEGFLQAIYVDRGTTVHRGQLLAQLDIPEMDAQIAEASAQVQTAAAEQSAARAKYMSDLGQSKRFQEAAQTPGVISESELETAKMTSMASLANIRAMENTKKARQAKVSALRKIHRYLQITAPIDGVVTQRLMHPGALVGPTSAEPIVRLQQIDRLRLSVSVPERYYGSIKVGTSIPFKVTAYPSTVFHGVIRRPSFTIDQKNRTEIVELDVANAQRKLSPGMYAEVHWPIARQESTFTVPSSAIVSTTERTFVNRVKNGTVEWVNIERGYTNGEQIEIFGDLHDGDEIVTSGSEEIREGSQVKTQHSPVKQ